MKKLALLAFLAACHASSKESAAPDAGAVVGSAEEIVEPAPSQSSAPLAKLADFDGGAPKRMPTGAIVLCHTHETWAPPDAFDVQKVDDGVAARRDHRLVAVSYPPHADDSYATITARFVTGQVTWEPAVMNKIDEWHAEQTVHGRAMGAMFTVRTLYAGVDAKTGKGRAGRDLSSPTSDVIWITAARTERESDALMDDARKKTLTLPDHACQCGTDCLGHK